MKGLSMGCFRAMAVAACAALAGVQTVSGETPSAPTGLVSRANLRIRDPFILVQDGLYYLYEAKPWFGGKGVNAYTSTDLEQWRPRGEVMRCNPDDQVTAVWAPEVHRYAGAYWLFVTLTQKEDPASPIRPIAASENYRVRGPARRGVWIYRAESPLGPFKPVRNGPVTPKEWMCLDGTLFVQDGTPWIIFCHEWCQTENGRMMAAPLTPDLSALAAEPIQLFRARDIPNMGEVTDGPFLWRTRDNRLQMIYSNFLLPAKHYCIARYESTTGKVQGPWRYTGLLFSQDGGHGMILQKPDGTLLIPLHSPNENGKERMKFLPIREGKDGLEPIPQTPANP